MVTSFVRGAMAQIFFLLAGVSLIRGSMSLSCYSCDSSVDENCATLEDISNFSIDICDQCATWIDGSRTLRACSSNMNESYPLTSICDEEFCNNAMFPENRLSCHTCEGSDCFDTQELLIQTCVNYNETDSCYSVQSNGSEASKGCMSDIDSAGLEMCQKFSSDCSTCDIRACNNEKFQLIERSTTLTCYSCNSEKESNCKFLQIESAAEEICSKELVEDQHCFSFSNETHFLRGCLSDFLESPDLCQDNCTSCQTDNCNSAQLIEQICYTCDSSTDVNCILNPKATQQITCNDSGSLNFGCYHNEREDITRRGCAIELTDEEALECSIGEICKKCDTNLCNDRPNIPTCFVCSSDKDPECVNLQSSNVSTKVCDLYTDTCRMFVVPTTKITVRGCSVETENVTCTPNTINCKECQENECNGGIIPSDRLECHRCTGEECSNSSLTICPNYYFRDLCFSHLGDNGEILSRGCTSDDDENAQACQEHSQFCFTCNEKGCNNVTHRPPSLSCIICDSLDLACMWGHEATAARSCRDDVLLTSQESCYIFKHEQYNIFIRGCTLDNNICAMYPTVDCQICEENGCNRAQIVEQYCVECNSIENNNCAEDAPSLNPVLCNGNLQYSMRGCYSINRDDVVTRGCFNDLDSDSRWECERDVMNETCSRCFENGCNVQSFSSGSRTHFTLALLILGTIFKFI